jgi:tetratricopeptide (TPR) repeat protein
MSANQEQREHLHEEASALYLQGDYVEALARWRTLLETDPSDERAAEGVRLCEGAADEVVESRPVTPVATSMGDDAERTLERLDQALGHDGPDWMDDASVGAVQGFDLTDPQEPPSIRVAPVRFDVPPPDAMGIDAQAVRLDLNELGLFDDGSLSSDAASDARGSSTAAAELEHRATELMAEAMQCYERGARDEALAALNRLAILDETNEAARTFAAHIRSELDSTGTIDMLSVPIAESDPLPPLPPPLASDPVATAPKLAVDDLPMPIPAAADDFAVPAGRRVKAKLDVPAPRKVSPRWIVIAASVVVLGVVGFLLFGRGGGASEPAIAGPGEPEAQATQRAGLGAPGGGSGQEAKPEATADKAPAPKPQTKAAGNLDELLARGRAAFDAGDYKAAVLAYNQALAIDSTNGEARERLQEAGEKYRSVKAADDGRAAAIDSFQRGDWVEALRLFYRVTPEGAEDQARITRYLRNGWYNLGIGALRTGDCKTARDHFREAKQHDAADPDVKRGLSLSARCSKATLTNEEYESVRALTPRGLDDGPEVSAGSASAP